MLNKHDPMQMYRSAKTAKVVHELEDKPKRGNKESALQSKITKWLKSEYPGIKFFSDFAAGLYLPQNIANIRSIQACEGKYLDLTILRPCLQYHALIIEIKVDGSDLFLVDGKTLKSDHVREQHESILDLRKHGYWADFGVGERDIKNIIEWYLLGNEPIYKEIIHRRG